MTTIIERPSDLRRRLASWGRVTPSDYRPDFRIEEKEEFLIIYDGDVLVAVMSREYVLIEIREFYPDGRHHSSFEITRPYHAPHMRGCFLCAYWRIGGSARVTSSSLDIACSNGGEELLIRIDEQFETDEWGLQEWRFYFDRALGCYAVDVRAELALHQPKLTEPTDLHAEGLGEPWPEASTLPETFWSNRDGGITFFSHNPLLPNTPGNMDWTGRRRVPVGGFFGLGCRPASNPVLEILSCSTNAIGFGTCSCFYDEHLWLGCPTRIEEDGKYHWRIQYRVVSIPEEFARSIVDQAERLDLALNDEEYDSWSYLNSIRAAGRQVQPFHETPPCALWTINDCEQALDANTYFPGLYWAFHAQPFGRSTWDRTVGYQSTSSIRLESRSPEARIEVGPTGPSIKVAPDQAFLFTAMVKTRLRPGAHATLKVWRFTLGRYDCPAPHVSEAVAEEADWTRVELYVPPCPEPHISFSLHLDGEGLAWFDDIGLLKVPLR
ncbi:MAG: hypothetical protein ACYC7E_11085 [Armatimonadota bacterium]